MSVLHRVGCPGPSEQPTIPHAAEPAQHGTREAYNAHRRHGEPPCVACAQWRANDQEKWRRTWPRRAADGQRRQTAQRRAMRRLAERYPDDYAELFDEEFFGPFKGTPRELAMNTREAG